MHHIEKDHALVCRIAEAEPRCEKEKGVNNCSVPLPPVLLPATLTIEQANKIQQLMDDPNAVAHSGRDLPKADPSVLRKKVR